MQRLSFLFIGVSIITLLACSGSKHVELNRDPDPRKDYANVFWKRQYTLFDKATDEPIFPKNKNGTLVYEIYYSSNENPNPFYGEFTIDELERHLFYKFKTRENCMIFCDKKNKQQ